MVKINNTMDNFLYKEFIINNSKGYKNKISLFNINNIFIGDFKYIIEVKNYINKNY